MRIFERIVCDSRLIYYIQKLYKLHVASQSLRINQVNERQVQLGDQFILSCVAVGSSDLKFSWYKDDMAVNMSKATR